VIFIAYLNPAMFDSNHKLGRQKFPAHKTFFERVLMDETVTRFLSAAQRSDAETVKVELDKDPNLHRTAITPVGNIALHLACATASLEVVRVLLNARANPYCANNNGDTPLMMSVVANNPRVLFEMLQHMKRVDGAVNQMGMDVYDLCCIAAPPKSAISLALLCCFTKDEDITSRLLPDKLIPLCCRSDNGLCVELAIRMGLPVSERHRQYLGQQQQQSIVASVLARDLKRAQQRADIYAQATLLGDVSVTHHCLLLLYFVFCC
jgi:hypothetical protein